MRAHSTTALHIYTLTDWIGGLYVCVRVFPLYIRERTCTVMGILHYLLYICSPPPFPLPLINGSVPSHHYSLAWNLTSSSTNFRARLLSAAWLTSPSRWRHEIRWRECLCSLPCEDDLCLASTDCRKCTLIFFPLPAAAVKASRYYFTRCAADIGTACHGWVQLWDRRHNSRLEQTLSDMPQLMLYQQSPPSPVHLV